MSAGGLKPISESQADSVEDTDQFSVKEDVSTGEDNAETPQQNEPTSGHFLKHGTLSLTENSDATSAATSDSDYDTDLETEADAESYDHTGKRVYLAACKSLGVVPVSYFLRNIQGEEIALKHHLIGPKGASALAAALELNTTLLNLNLHDNALGGEGGEAIATMLKENCYITELDVSSNNLGAYGCYCICDMLQYNVTLLKLDLSNNGFDDKDTANLLEGFKGNDKLMSLNLSNNKFSEKSGENLGLGISSNDALEYLDLSWNHLRRKGAVDLAFGLRTNCTLKKLNLSYNGFSNDGALALGEALRANNTLIELDVSNNRITMPGAMCIAKGLEGNNTLEILKIGTNPIGSPGARAILTASQNYADSAVTQLDFTEIYLDEEFNAQLEEVRLVKPDIRIVANLQVGAKNPLKLIKNYIIANQDQWLEHCQEFDPDGSLKISRTDFAKCLKKADIVLGTEETARLMTQLDRRNDGFINYTERILGFQQLQPTEQVERTAS